MCFGCIYCKQELSSKQALEKHQTKTKACLKLQEEYKIQLRINNEVKIQREIIEKLKDKKINKLKLKIKELEQIININNFSKKKRKKAYVGVILKTQVWNTYIGVDYGKIRCPHCLENDITQLHFEFGHIIAQSEGGETSVENSRPLCDQCNKSIGKKKLNTEKWDAGLKFAKLKINEMREQLKETINVEKKEENINDTI